MHDFYHISKVLRETLVTQHFLDILDRHFHLASVVGLWFSLGLRKLVGWLAALIIVCEVVWEFFLVLSLENSVEAFVCQEVKTTLMWFFWHPFTKLFWFLLRLDSSEMTIFFMSHFVLQIEYSKSLLTSNLLSFKLHLLNHRFNVRGRLLESSPIAIETVFLSQILESELRTHLWGQVLVPLNYGVHSLSFVLHEYGGDIVSLLVNYHFLGSFLHVIEVRKLWSWTEPAQQGLSITSLRTTCWLENAAINLCRLDKQPVWIQGFHQLPINLNVLQHLFVLQVATILLEIEFDRSLVSWWQLNIVHLQHIKEGIR